MESMLAISKTSGKRPRNDLTLKEKYDVIQQLKQHVPYRKLANDFNCSIGQISRIFVNRIEIEKRFAENINSKVKRLKAAPNQDVNEAVWLWFQTVTAQGIPLSG